MLLSVFIQHAETQKVWGLIQDHSDTNFVEFLAAELVLNSSLDVQFLRSDENNLPSPVCDKICFHT